MRFSEEEIAKLRLVLKRISFLEFLKFSEMDALINSLEKKSFQPGETIIKQGTKGDNFYIMGAGTVGIYHEKFLSRKKLATLGPEAFFGEMALIDTSPRTATIVGETPGEAYTLSRAAFSEILLKNPMISQVIKQTSAYRKAQNKALESK